MRRPMIAGNWKMNKTPAETVALLSELKKIQPQTNVEVVVCPMTVSLFAAGPQLKGSDIKLGAQNVHFEDKGAFTGEANLASLKELGVEYVILGHSERRQYFGETDETVNKKTHKVLEGGLKPIVCVGESQRQKELGITNEIVCMQTKAALSGVTAAQVRDVVIAYEPVWAIGSGKVPTPEYVQDVAAQIRAAVSEVAGQDCAKRCYVLYGGSVKSGNAAFFTACADVDGVLVGGDALDANKFIDIVKAVLHV